MLPILILIDDNNGNLLCKDSRRQTFCKVLSNVLVSELEAIPGFPMLSASQWVQLASDSIHVQLNMDGWHSNDQKQSMMQSPHLTKVLTNHA